MAPHNWMALAVITTLGALGCSAANQDTRKDDVEEDLGDTTSAATGGYKWSCKIQCIAHSVDNFGLPIAHFRYGWGYSNDFKGARACSNAQVNAEAKFPPDNEFGNPIYIDKCFKTDGNGTFYGPD